jgi:hypothetical protein
MLFLDEVCTENKQENSRYQRITPRSEGTPQFTFEALDFIAWLADAFHGTQRKISRVSSGHTLYRWLQVFGSLSSMHLEPSACFWC